MGYVRLYKTAAGKPEAIMEIEFYEEAEHALRILTNKAVNVIGKVEVCNEVTEITPEMASQLQWNKQTKL